jgi:hypothetical protein
VAADPPTLEARLAAEQGAEQAASALAQLSAGSLASRSTEHPCLEIVQHLAGETWSMTFATGVYKLTARGEIAAVPTGPTVEVETPPDRDRETVELRSFARDPLALAGLIESLHSGHRCRVGPELLRPAEAAVVHRAEPACFTRVTA